MKLDIAKKYFYHLLITGVLVLSACTKDYTNPSAVPEASAFSTPQAMTGVAIGLQRTYTAGRASSLYNKITLDGLLTNQLIVLNQGNTSEYQLQLGSGSVDGTNTILGGLWTTSNKIIYDADRVIAAADGLGDKNYSSGLIGYATIFKALALGDLAMFWQKIPASIGQTVSFSDRGEGFTKAITAIDKALAGISANAISSLFLSSLPPGSPTIEIVPTLQALKARYSLFVGNYGQALLAANAVDLTKRSVLNFSSVNLNPIFETATSTNNVYAVGDATTLGLPVGLQPDPADKRLPFYTTSAYASKIAGFGVGTVTAFPIYLPGEVTLIKAEAYARQNDLVNAVFELNKIVTKQPASDPFGVGAGLPPVAPVTQQDILDQIYKHRSIELFLSGLKLEDMRRFNRPTAERKRNFLPYPFLERDNNTNTPPDPAF